MRLSGRPDMGFPLPWPVLFVYSGVTQGCLLREVGVGEMRALALKDPSVTSWLSIACIKRL